MMERQLGRESQKDNDLFYTCSLIDYIARKTKNKRVAVVDALGKERIAKIYDLADIYHNDNIERVSDDFIEAAKMGLLIMWQNVNMPFLPIGISEKYISD